MCQFCATDGKGNSHERHLHFYMLFSNVRLTLRHKARLNCSVYPPILLLNFKNLTLYLCWLALLGSKQCGDRRIFRQGIWNLSHSTSKPLVEAAAANSINKEHPTSTNLIFIMIILLKKCRCWLSFLLLRLLPHNVSEDDNSSGC